MCHSIRKLNMPRTTTPWTGLAFLYIIKWAVLLYVDRERSFIVFEILDFNRVTVKVKTAAHIGWNY